jgi:hypothetical protein
MFVTTTRKYSSFFPDSADHKAILTLSPTNVHSEIGIKDNDFWWKYVKIKE